MTVRRSRATTLRRRARRRRERKRMLRIAAITVSVALAASAVLVGIGMLTAPSSETYCVTEPTTFPAQGVDGWSGDQLENAAIIVRTARDLGFRRDGQILGVMAAMGESSLHNIDYGDWETSGVTNPDGSRTSSVGLFQQQKWWGSVVERMDPSVAASKFYARLKKVPDWRSLPPSHAIHRVQINADQEHYARFQGDASAVVDALSGECSG